MGVLKGSEIMKLVLVLVLGLLYCEAAVELIHIDDNSYTTIRSVNYPNPYPRGNAEWQVAPGGGEGVEFIIRDLDLNSEKGDYLLIRPGPKSSTEPPLVFSWYLDNQRMYRIMHQDTIYILFSANAGGVDHKGFEIDLKRITETVTTTEMISTTEPPNTIFPYENTTIYLIGMTHEEFYANHSQNFTIKLAEVAVDFCRTHNITIGENITVVENVNYHLIGQCKLAWPVGDDCIQIIYSISINYDNETDTYELSRSNLDKMWTEYSTRILEDIGLQNYQPPNDRVYITIWVGISIGVVLLFMLFILLLWRNGCLDGAIKSILIYEDTEDNKKADVSLFPIPHQSVPPLYGLEFYGSEEQSSWNADSIYAFNDKPDPFESHENFGFDDDIVVMSIDPTIRDNPSRKRSSAENYDVGESVL